MNSGSQIEIARIDAALAELRRLGRPQRHRDNHLRRGHLRLAGLARHRMLSVLAERPGLGVTELAEAIGVDQPRASRLVQDATDAGLIIRKPDPRDGRRSVVELSTAGRDHLERTVRERRESVEAGLSGFSASETTVFANLLERYVAGLQDDSASPSSAATS